MILALSALAVPLLVPNRPLNYSLSLSPEPTIFPPTIIIIEPTSASLATTLYCLGAIQFVMALPVAWAVRSGLLSHPPTQAEFDAWTGHEESEVAKEDGPAGRPPGTSPYTPTTHTTRRA